MSIPKIIHYCWFGGKPLPEEAKCFIDTWKKYCPEYHIQQWNENNFDINQNQYCREAYAAKKWAFVADYVRLKVLYEYGGIYMDTDVELKKTLNDLLSYDAFMCFESDNLVSIGTLGAKPKSKVINDFLDAYKNRSFKNKDQSLDLTPNLSIVTRILDEKYGLAHSGQRQILPENILVLPMESFIAKDYYTGWIMEDESTYAIHHYTATWLDERRKQYSVTHRKYVLQYLKIAKEIVVKLASIRATAEIYGISEAMKKIINKMLRNGGADRKYPHRLLSLQRKCLSSWNNEVAA